MTLKRTALAIRLVTAALLFVQTARFLLHARGAVEVGLAATELAAVVAFAIWPRMALLLLGVFAFAAVLHVTRGEVPWTLAYPAMLVILVSTIERQKESTT